MNWPALVIALVLLGPLACSSARAINKCVDTTGAVHYTDGLCPAGSAGKEVVVVPNTVAGQAGDRPVQIRAAIAARRPVVGMTQAELQRAMGNPDKVNAAQYGSELKDQLIYYTDSRTIYVYVTNGIVTAIQNTEGGRPQATASTYPTPSRACPSPRDIRNIEFELSKLENRDRPQVLAELHRQLGEARRCSP